MVTRKAGRSQEAVIPSMFILVSSAKLSPEVLSISNAEIGVSFSVLGAACALWEVG